MTGWREAGGCSIEPIVQLMLSVRHLVHQMDGAPNIYGLCETNSSTVVLSGIMSFEVTPL